jgi:hypothetical protein
LQSGVNIETIRYYEKIGVMPAPGRSAGGFRIYGPDHLKRLSFVRRGRQLGFSLDEIRNLLRLVDGHGHTCAEVHALMLSHLAEIPPAGDGGDGGAVQWRKRARMPNCRCSLRCAGGGSASVSSQYHVRLAHS